MPCMLSSAFASVQGCLILQPCHQVQEPRLGDVHINECLTCTALQKTVSPSDRWIMIVIVPLPPASSLLNVLSNSKKALENPERNSFSRLLSPPSRPPPWQPTWDSCGTLKDTHWTRYSLAHWVQAKLHSRFLRHRSASELWLVGSPWEESVRTLSRQNLSKNAPDKKQPTSEKN